MMEQQPRTTATLRRKQPEMKESQEEKTEKTEGKVLQKLLKLQTTSSTSSNTCNKEGQLLAISTACIQNKILQRASTRRTTQNLKLGACGKNIGS